jgi:hypothetical protein
MTGRKRKAKPFVPLDQRAPDVAAQIKRAMQKHQPKSNLADRVTVEEPILTQAEIKALTQPKNEETWREALAGICADFLFILGSAVIFLLLFDAGIMGIAGYKFAVELLDKAEQFQP